MGAVRFRHRTSAMEPLPAGASFVRPLAILFATLGLAACGRAPVTRSGSVAASSTQGVAPASPLHAEQRAPMDSVVQFLLTAAATDFHTHRPPDPVRFRDVRLGHVMFAGRAHAAGYCQDSSIIWDEVGDLSSSLQSRLESLR